MENPQDIYVSLDEARNELIKRKRDESLKQHVRQEIGSLFMPAFDVVPRAALWRFIMSPDNGFTHFLHQAHYVNAKPLAFDYLDDTFLTLNAEKKGLGRLHVEDLGLATVDIMNFHANEKKKMNDVETLSGQSLVEFHDSLFLASKYKIEKQDISPWCHAQGQPADYYYPYLAHFIAHGVLFESYLIEDDDSREVSFTHEIVIPAIERLVSTFGVKPLIVRLYPEQQTDEEDFYWWSYPPHVNDFILQYAKSHGLRSKPRTP